MLICPLYLKNKNKNSRGWEICSVSALYRVIMFAILVATYKIIHVQVFGTLHIGEIMCNQNRDCSITCAFFFFLISSLYLDLLDF